MERKLNTENKPITIEDNLVVTMDYELKIDDAIVDTSDDGDPIIFLQGAGQIIAGLEKSIYGLKVGDQKTIVVEPKDGYGEIDPESIVEVPKDEFPEDFPLELGVEITVNTEDDEEDAEEEEMEATIVAVNDKTVTLDFNHPLAGKILNFSVKVLEIREATAEEIEHQHVHGDDSEFYFEDEDFDELDDLDELDEESESNNHH
jgi:FKBP-type peptidyl-prolyl cis-trans isomerase SlyD